MHHDPQASLWFLVPSCCGYSCDQALSKPCSAHSRRCACGRILFKISGQADRESSFFPTLHSGLTRFSPSSLRMQVPFAFLDSTCYTCNTISQPSVADIASSQSPLVRRRSLTNSHGPFARLHPPFVRFVSSSNHRLRPGPWLPACPIPSAHCLRSLASTRLGLRVLSNRLVPSSRCSRCLKP